MNFVPLLDSCPTDESQAELYLCSGSTPDAVVRTLWMVPRPVRKIECWKLVRVLLQFKCLLMRSWDTEAQDQFIAGLEHNNLKSKYGGYDDNGGGGRTYFSMLEQLGLVCTFRSAGKSRVWLTNAGEELIRTSDPAILIHQMMLAQYPCAYSTGRMVNIDPCVRIRPYLFLVHLAQVHSYLTEDEIVLAMALGHTFDDEEKVSASISNLRSELLNGRDSADVVRELLPANLLLTQKLAKSNLKAKAKMLAKVARGEMTPKEVDLHLYHCLYVNARSIANTFKNNLTATRLWLSYQGSTERWTNNPDVALPALAEHWPGRRNMIDFTPDNAAKRLHFQRVFGKFPREKDTRRMPMGEENPKDTQELKLTIIEQDFCDYAALHPVLGMPDTWIKAKALEMSLDAERIEARIRPKLRHVLSLFEQNYLDASEDKRGITFEKMTVELFRAHWGVEAYHTGQMRRKAGVGGFGDAMLLPNSSGCGIIDTKSIRNYVLPHSDYSKTKGTYIPTFREVLAALHQKDHALRFFLFVVASIGSGAAYKLHLLSNETGVPISMISAHGLLAHARAKTSWEELYSKLLVGGVISVPATVD